MSALLRLIEILGVFVAAGYVVVQLLALVSQWRQSRRRLLILLIGLLAGSVMDAQAADETRCTELGVNCICAAKMDTSGWTDVSSPNGNNWKPNDYVSGDTQCNSGNNAGAVYSTDLFRLVHEDSTSNPTMFAALPAAGQSSVSHLWRTAISSAAGSAVDGGFMGTKNSSGFPSGRIGIRFYRYYSSDYTFSQDGAGTTNCNSLKIVQAGYNGAGSGGPLVQGVGGAGWGFYDVTTSTGWSANVSCCVDPDLPGQSGTLPTSASVKGKWVRHEVYINNNTTSGTSSVEVYFKNVTDGTAEVTIVNTAGDARFTGVHPSSVITDLHANGFRSNNGDACNGYHAQTYLLVAAWDTNLGQRINAAYEIEGGGVGGSTGSPILFISQVAPLVTMIHVIGFGAVLWQRRSTVVRSSLMAWRYAVEHTQKMYWVYRYKRAVSRWQKEAPVMLEHRPQSMETVKPLSHEQVQ